MGRGYEHGAGSPPSPPALHKAGLPPCCLQVLAMENHIVPQWLYPRAAAISPPITACPHLADGTESPSGCFPAQQGWIQHVQHPTPGRGMEGTSCRTGGGIQGSSQWVSIVLRSQCRPPRSPQLLDSPPFPFFPPPPFAWGCPISPMPSWLLTPPGWAGPAASPPAAPHRLVQLGWERL